MQSSQFIRALQSATDKDLSYELRQFTVTESSSKEYVATKNISCNFLAGFRFGYAEVFMSLGISVNYHSTDGKSFSRDPLQRVDYLDSILINGLSDIEGGRFDLVFLLEQMEAQGIQHAGYVYEKIVKRIIDLFFSIVDVQNEHIQMLLTNGFDDFVLKMPDVLRLNVQDQNSLDRFGLELNKIKMSEVTEGLKNAKHRVSSVSLFESTNLHDFLIGNITTGFIVSGFRFVVKYRITRKYARNIYSASSTKIIGINNAHIEQIKLIRVSTKVRQVDLNLLDKEASLNTLDGNMSLYLKLQALFGMVKRCHSLSIITDEFDKFYLTHLQSLEKKKNIPDSLHFDHLYWRPSVKK